MKTFGLLCKISINYWKNHVTRLFAFLFTIILGSAALCNAALLIRSNKAATLEEELRLLGNYDIIIYDLDEEAYNQIGKFSEVTSIGSYIELGYISDAENSNLYKAAFFEDEKSEDMYHMTCSSGNYPVSEDEIAIDIKIAKLLGVKPELGEAVRLTLYDLDREEVVTKEFTICGLFEASNESVYGGWYRYPVNQALDEYSMPGVFLSNAIKEYFTIIKM